MNLITERLLLRPWEETDAESLYEYAKDPAIGPAAGWPVHTSAEESREVIKTVLSLPETYAVCLREDGWLIGCLAMKRSGHTDMTERDDECELGFWIGKPYWGRGYMPEAVREVLRHGFTELGMTTIWCGYYDGNEKSKRVQEKCGFRHHHTCDDVPVPLMHETRVGHTNVLTKEDWRRSFAVRSLEEHEIPAALALAWRVFSEYEAPDYSPEGTAEFYHCLHDESYLAGIEYFGAFDRERLVGMAGIRRDNAHICFCFVDGKYHRLGLATRLFALVKEEYAGRSITVNSSPCGLPFYKSLGFIETDSEQTVNGIRFTPMIYKITESESQK